MRIQHNITAMNANRQLNITGGTLAKSARNLSSGYKINMAADDAAGLSISEKMRKQIRGLTKASENSEDGISMVQVADGAMAEVHDMIDRCIELSIKAANGTNSESDRGKIQEEIDQIIKEIDTIQERTKFNEIYVLKGESAYLQKPVATEIVNQGSLPTWVVSPSTDPKNVVNGKSIMAEEYAKTYQYKKSTTTVTSTTSPSGFVTKVTTVPVTVTHAAASLDFSAMTAANKSDLIGMGFNMTCCTCYNYYSVEFTDGDDVEEDTTFGAYIYRIGIDNINNGEDLVKKIVEVTKGNPANHYTNLEVDPNNSQKLWVYDHRGKNMAPSSISSSGYSNWVDWKGIGAGYWNCKPNAASGSGLFGTGVMRSRQIMKDDRRVDNPNQLALQVGSETGNFMCLKMAAISSYALGVDNIDVRGGYILEDKIIQDEDGNDRMVQVKVGGAEQAIKAFNKAKDYVSRERSRLGAYQNRLEHTVGNLDNVVENTTASESQIRDTDMAKEMVQYSNKNILLQAGQAMLSQANQSRQGILSLLSA